MNIEYDDRFNMIDVYQYHKELLPFVGDRFNEYRVLHVGESHYVNNSIGYNLEYMKNWWNDSCKGFSENYAGWFCTRDVINNFMNGDGGRAHRIFFNFAKSFAKSVFNTEVSKKEAYQLYDFFAFMNFFQMPSLSRGNSFWKGLVSNSRENNELASQIWRDTVNKSIETLDRVIDIITPNLIVFTSISAGEAYKSNENAKYGNDARVIYTSHPGSPYSWNKPLKSLNGRTGKEIAESGFRILLNSNLE